MSHYSDITGNTAAGNLDRELKKMRKEAETLAQLQKRGKLSYEQVMSARRRFTGIYRHILEKAIGF
jgi:hypothetical protein